MMRWLTSHPWGMRTFVVAWLVTSPIHITCVLLYIGGKTVAREVPSAYRDAFKALKTGKQV